MDLGIIEGYFGPAWSWPDRHATMQFLSGYSYRFFIYAPKADCFLRRRWREPFPTDTLRQLASFAGACRDRRVRFGIGLSPIEAYRDFDTATRAALRSKLAVFDEIGIDDLAILFDDMRADSADLAERQLEIIDFASAHTRANRIIMCPTYYSDDPVLDRIFGVRPADYLATIGRQLDPAIKVFWTGEEVCAREQSVAHLRGIAQQLRRKPILWDNYPVNDGPRMSQYLHLRGFTGRPAAIADCLCAHAINPALQATLTRVPAMTLSQSYLLGTDYRYGDVFRTAAQTVLGTDLAATVQADLIDLQDTGLDRLGEAHKSLLRQRYTQFDHDAAREIVRWLDGVYLVNAELVQTQ